MGKEFICLFVLLDFEFFGYKVLYGGLFGFWFILFLGWGFVGVLILLSGFRLRLGLGLGLSWVGCSVLEIW